MSGEPMHLELLTDQRELAGLAEAWNALAGETPFRRFEWLATWWKHYGGGRQLLAIVVRDAQGQVVGLAPWYAERHRARGTVIAQLGSGEVLSDYVSLLARPGCEESVAEQIAAWLIPHPAAGNGTERGRAVESSAAAAPSISWDCLELDGAPPDDPAVNHLLQKLGGRGAAVEVAAEMSFWRIALPEDWEAYLAMLSKSHRKQVRRLVRVLDAAEGAVLHRAAAAEELDRGMAVLVDLHQRRRKSLGQRGCFASPRFAAFLHEAAQKLLADGRLALYWLELAGRPIAAEFQLLGGGTTFAYQSGVDPDCLDAEPGRLMHIAALREAIARGDRAFDFLRGDEPYKAHWRAEPTPSLRIHVVPPRETARWRHAAWQLGRQARGWLREAARRARLQAAAALAAMTQRAAAVGRGAG